MIELTQEELKQHFSEPIFGQIAETADTLGMECYVVGGYVRDIFLQRPSKDIDVVVVGSGIAMAEALGKQLGRGAHGIRVNLLLKTARWKTIRIVAISRSMLWPYVSIKHVLVNW